jgi:hypothetical protein
MKMNAFPRPADQPEVAAEQTKLHQLRHDLSVAERQRNSATLAGDGDCRDHAALALLGQAPPESESVESSTAKIRTWQRAIEIQRSRLAEAGRAASRQIAGRLRPDYAKLIARGAKAMRALRDYLADEEAFCTSVFDAGIEPQGTLPRFPLPLDTERCDAWLAAVGQEYSV